MNSLSCEASTLEWFALYVRTGKEHDVAGILERKGIEAYLPVRRARSARAKRKEALFPSYCFCRVDLGDRSSMVITTPWVYGFVSSANRSVRIPDREIEGIKRMQSQDQAIEVIDSRELCAGGRMVRICGGPFKGLRGRVVQRRGQDRFALDIEAVQQSLVVEVERSLLTLE